MPFTVTMAVCGPGESPAEFVVTLIGAEAPEGSVPDSGGLVTVSHVPPPVIVAFHVSVEPGAPTLVTVMMPPGVEELRLRGTVGITPMLATGSQRMTKLAVSPLFASVSVGSDAGQLETAEFAKPHTVFSEYKAPAEPAVGLLV